jgi:glycosyltransferase involved in cell wall biosynthesis
MKLSIVVPVYNEEATINEILLKVVRATLPEKVQKEIIIVDDASRDDSYIKALNFKQEHEGTLKIKLIRHNTNKGKGAAVVDGINLSSGELVVIQDADLEYDPNDYVKLIEPLLSGKADVVYGTRLKNYPLRLFGEKRTPLVLHYLGNKFLTFVTEILYQKKVSDMETCYKMFKRDVLKEIKIRAKRFDFEPEFTAKVLKRGYKIYEVPIKVKPRGYDEGKKISWRDGFTAIWTLIKYRFVD